MRKIEQQHRERIQQAFSVLSLGEIQLLLLGLWVIGEENRVDPRLETEYGWLLNSLAALAQGTASHVISGTPPIAGIEVGPDPPGSRPR
jgi:hypothetical protein